MPKRSHPAHRTSQYGSERDFEPYTPTLEGCSIEELIRELANAATPSETPGVAKDELAEQLIGLARQWVEREERTNRFLTELGL